MKYKILIVDDESSARFGMRKALTFRENLILESENLKKSRILVEAEKPDLILLDINLPDGSGLEFLSELQQTAPDTLVVMVTAYGSERVAIEAIKMGAYDYLSKPFEVDDLRLAVKNATEKIRLRRENRRLRQRVEQAAGLGELFGESAAMKRLFELIEKVSATDVTVLIQGESGTGKELVAREIHRRGVRTNGPFVATNCAAMPETLIESELFGHEKGAFTGASSQRQGKFELADRGTLFLDEIGDMSLSTQSKVLRALEERVFERLGGNKTITTDARIISATHRDLREESRGGKFREDLFYRLCVVTLQIPPLKERGADILLLAERFGKLFSERHGRGGFELTVEARKKLTEHSWPGNVRELKNVIEQAVVLSGAGPIAVKDLPKTIRRGKPAGAGVAESSRAFAGMKYADAKNLFEREYFTAFLDETGGNLTRAADLMGVHRQTLQYKLKRLGIRKRWSD